LGLTSSTRVLKPGRSHLQGVKSWTCANLISFFEVSKDALHQYYALKRFWFVDLRRTRVSGRLVRIFGFLPEALCFYILSLKFLVLYF